MLRLSVHDGCGCGKAGPRAGRSPGRSTAGQTADSDRKCCVCQSAGGWVSCRLVCLCGRAAQRLAVVLQRMAGKGRARFCGRTHSLQRSLCDYFGCTSRSSSAADGRGPKCDATRGAASKRAADASRASYQRPLSRLMPACILPLAGHMLVLPWGAETRLHTVAQSGRAFAFASLCVRPALVEGASGDKDVLQTRL